VHRKSRFFTAERTTCTRSGGREPAVVWESHLLRQFRIHSQTIVVRKPWSGGRQPAVFVGNARARMTTPGFTQRRRARIRSGGCQPAVCRADALAKALLHLLGRLPTGVLAHSVALP